MTRVRAARHSGVGAWLLIGIPLVFFGVFFLWPVAHLILVALRPDGQWDLAAPMATLADPQIQGVIVFTLVQAVASTLLTLVLALPGAWVIGHLRFRGRGLIEALAVTAFVMPTVVVATAMSAVLADDGPLAWLLPEGSNRGLPAIFAAHVYLNLAIVLRMVGSYWSQLDPRMEQAAATLGAGRWRTLWSVTRPALTPIVLAAAAIVFLFTFTSFGIVLILGEFGQATIEVEIQRQVLFLFDLPAGAALTVVQMVMVLVALLVQTRLSARAAREQDLGIRRVLPRPRTAPQRVAVMAFLGGYGAVFVLPVLMVVERSLRVADGYSLRNYLLLGDNPADSTLFVSPATAIANSLAYGIAAMLIATTVGLVVALNLARRTESMLDSIWLLPLGVSAVTLGFGMLITFDEPPLPLRGTWVLVPLAQSLVAIPFVVRALLPVLRSIRGSIHEAAATLGASPRRIVTAIDLPIVSRALAVAMGFSLAISLGEFGATLFVADGSHPTVPIAIYRLQANPGASNYGQSMAMAAILIVMTALAVLLTDRFRMGGRDV